MDLRSQILELKENLAVFRGREKDLLERNGVVRTLESLNEDLKKTEKTLAIQKEVTKELRKRREDALQSVCLKISTETDKFLTEGEASIEIDEGKVKIGWIINGKHHPIQSLSGGEKVEFLQAFSQVLSPAETKLKLSFIELAETGDQAGKILNQIIQSRGENSQTIACSWQTDLVPTNGWVVKKL